MILLTYLLASDAGATSSQPQSPVKSPTTEIGAASLTVDAAITVAVTPLTAADPAVAPTSSSAPGTPAKSPTEDAPTVVVEQHSDPAAAMTSPTDTSGSLLPPAVASPTTGEVPASSSSLVPVVSPTDDTPKPVVPTQADVDNAIQDAESTGASSVHSPTTGDAPIPVTDATVAAPTTEGVFAPTPPRSPTEGTQTPSEHSQQQTFADEIQALVAQGYTLRDQLGDLLRRIQAISDAQAAFGNAPSSASSNQ